MSQPIALPPSANNQDSSMESGSYTGANGSFNPASYTRHFMGSPISWRAGSFGNRFHPGTSPNQLQQSPFDVNDFKMGKLSSSVESDRGSILNGLTRDGELCRDYSCCGLELTDLHALIEHFEEVHVIVIDPNSQIPIQPSLIPYPNPNPNLSEQATPQQPSYFPAPNQQLRQLHPSSSSQNQHYNSDHVSGPFDPDDMELDMDTSTSTSAPSSGGPSPPDTPISTPQSSYPSPSVYGHHNLPHTSFSAPGSTCPSPHAANLVSAHLDQAPVSAFETTTILRVPSIMRRRHSPLSTFPPTRSQSGNLLTSPDAFNMYSGYSNYSSTMPGTPAYAQGEDAASQESQAISTSNQTSPVLNPDPGLNQYGNCVPPALLYAQAASAASTSAPTSRVPSPSSLPPLTINSGVTAASSHTSPQSATSPRPSTTLSRPASSLLLSKPFKCPKPNCNKSYKQANGLKYHITHGSCNFAPPKDLEQVQALLASKRAAAAANRHGSQSPPSTPHSPGGSPADIDVGMGLGMITETELREVEREAEKRLRPFACGIGDCQRRYKNMNGLRYHYQHSGDHGAIGLAQLASGTHECLINSASHRSASSANSRVGSRVTSRQPSRERVRGSVSVPATPIHAHSSNPVNGTQQSAPPTAYIPPPQTQAGYSYSPQQQAQMAYQQQFAQHQRLQYQQQMQAQKNAQLKQTSGSFAIPPQQQYLGMALGGENGLPG